MLSYMVRNHYKTICNWTSVRQLTKRIKLNLIMENTNARWAFNGSLWNPTLEEVTAASSYIQEEEIERLSKFYFQKDAMSSLVGRLMIRKYVHLATSIPYEELRFSRDERGKPYLVGAGDMQLQFNVSHQGDFVVLAGNMHGDVGIDIMKIEPPVNKNIPEFFRLMNRQFSDHEWSYIRSFTSEMERIASFYRIWCLKECYVKNLGCGITVPLKDLSFSIHTRQLEVGKASIDTELYKCGVLQKDWVFEETLLDEKHTVAVSVRCEDKSKHVPIGYTYLNFEELVKEARPLHEPNIAFSCDFMKKGVKPF